MRVIIGSISVLLVVALMGFKNQGNEHCPSTTGSRALITCGSCHYSAINPDIVIGMESLDEKSSGYAINLEILNAGYASFEAIIDAENSSFVRAVKSSDIAASSSGQNVLVSSVQQSGTFNGKKEAVVQISFEVVPVSSEKEEVITIQGVLSNNDGTPHGDVSFKREILLSPTTEREFYVYPTVAKSDLSIEVNKYYHNEVAKIYNATGKMIKTLKLYNEKNVLSIEALLPGYYFVSVGEGPDQQIKRFVVSK